MKHLDRINNDSNIGGLSVIYIWIGAKVSYFFLLMDSKHIK